MTREALWDAEQWRIHGQVHALLHELAADTLEQARLAVQEERPLTECRLQALLSAGLDDRRLGAIHAPRVAVNEHTADPSFTPSPDADLPIEEGSLVTVHLAARPVSAPSVHATCLLTAWVGRRVPDQVAAAFEVVCRGRDVTADYLREAFADQREVHGWEVDAVCHREIVGMGYGARLRHGTGYRLGCDSPPRGGPHLDDASAEDERVLAAGMAFALEPGLYVPDRFGVRAGANVYLDPGGGLRMARPVQRTILVLPVRT